MSISTNYSNLIDDNSGRESDLSKLALTAYWAKTLHKGNKYTADKVVYWIVIIIVDYSMQCQIHILDTETVMMI